MGLWKKIPIYIKNWVVFSNPPKMAKKKWEFLTSLLYHSRFLSNKKLPHLHLFFQESSPGQLNLSASTTASNGMGKAWNPLTVRMAGWRRRFGRSVCLIVSDWGCWIPYPLSERLYLESASLFTSFTHKNVDPYLYSTWEYFGSECLLEEILRSGIWSM